MVCLEQGLGKGSEGIADQKKNRDHRYHRILEIGWNTPES